MAAALADYLAGKAANVPIWGWTWARDHHGAEMLRVDLEAAGIPYTTEGVDGPEYADFHSLRHSYLTLGGRSGIDLRTLQDLAGHSKPELTARYSHRRLYDLAGAVDKLPNLVPKRDADAAETPLRLTGTDFTTVNRDTRSASATGKNKDLGAVPGVPPGVPAGRAEPHQSAPSYTSGQEGKGSGDSTQPLEMKGAGACLHRPASDCPDAPRRTRNIRRKHHIRQYVTQSR